MYQLPEDAWLRPLIGQRLIEISCTINQVIFHFSDDAWIMACREFRLISDGGDLEVSLPLSDAAVFRLLECAVRGVSTSDGRTSLHVDFGDRQSLSFSGETNYESFHVCINDDERII